MKTKLSFLFIFFLKISFTQTELASFTPLTSKPKIEQFVANANNDGLIGISYMLKKKVYFYLSNQQNEVLLKEARGTQPEVNHQPIGKTASSSYITHFYNYGNFNTAIRGVGYDIKEQAFFQFQTAKMPSNETIIVDSFEEDNFFRVCVDKETNELIINRFSNQKRKFEATKFKITNHLVERLCKKRKILLANSTKADYGQVIAISQKHILDFSQAAISIKIYQLSPTQVAISLDGLVSSKLNRTELLIFDWETGEMEQRFYGQSTIISTRPIANSILFKEHLYHISITSSYLNLEIHNISNNEKVQGFYYTEKDASMDIVNGNLIMKNQGLNFRNNNKNPINKSKVKDLLKRLKISQPYIYPKLYQDGAYFLTIGSYIVPNYSSSGGVFMPGNTISTPQGSVTIPGGVSPMSGGFSGDVMNSYFHVTLDSTDFEVENRTLPLRTTANRMKLFQNRILSPYHTSNGFYIPNLRQYGFVHYLRKENRIKVSSLW